MSEYVAVYEYAKRNRITIQTAYRWIREHKIPAADIVREKKLVERIKVRADSVPKKHYVKT